MRRLPFSSNRILLSSVLALAGALQACSDDAPSGPSSGTHATTTATTGAGSGATGSGTGMAGATGSSTATTTTAATSGAGGQGGGAGGSAGAGGSIGGAAGGSAGGAIDGGGTTDAALEGGGNTDGGDGCGTALYCDSFDSYTAPGNPGGKWITSTAYSGNMNGVVSVDTTHFYSGKNAVHLMTPGTTGSEHAFITLQGAPYFPVPDNIFFGRMMVYFTRTPTSIAHWTLIQGQGTMVPGFPNLTEAVYRYGGQINGNLFMANYDTQPGRLSDCAQRSQTKVPLNVWTCIEWRFDGKLKELDFWMNGTINPALSVRQKANNTGTCQNTSWSGIWEPPTFNSIGVGFQHYQQGAGELWIDDFAIDTKKIGCPPAQPGAM